MVDRPFLWGTAYCAHQVEGGNVNSDFWLAENITPSLFREPSADACDTWHRYEEDVALVADLGLNCHRFGIEWARIEPEPGQFSLAALDRYRRVLEACHNRGVAPMVSFNHWTVPRWFAAMGGFENAESPALFARFAERATACLGDLIAYASTFNEANIQRVLGIRGRSDSFRARRDAMYQACAQACGSDRFSMVLFADAERIEPNMVAAHDAAIAAMRAGPGNFQVGVTISMQAVETAEGAGDDQVHAAEQALYGPWIDAAARADFVGVQTYTRLRVGPSGVLPPPDGAERTDAGYEFYPEALEATIRFAAQATGRPVIVTENGIATTDDTRRVEYIRRALAGVAHCLADDIDVRGYLHWSLLDNFEWVFGYAQKFGLVEVDPKTFERRPKPSARFLGDCAKAGLLSGE